MRAPSTHSTGSLTLRSHQFGRNDILLFIVYAEIHCRGDFVVRPGVREGREGALPPHGTVSPPQSALGKVK